MLRRERGASPKSGHGAWRAAAAAAPILCAVFIAWRAHERLARARAGALGLALLLRDDLSAHCLLVHRPELLRELLELGDRLRRVTELREVLLSVVEHGVEVGVVLAREVVRLLPRERADVHLRREMARGGQGVAHGGWRVTRGAP